MGICDKDMEYIDLRKVGRERDSRRYVGRWYGSRKWAKRERKRGSDRSTPESRKRNMDRVSTRGRTLPATKMLARTPGTHWVLPPEEHKTVRTAVEEKIPEDFGITGKLWTIGRTGEYIQKQYGKTVNARTPSDYVKRWGDELPASSEAHAETES